MAGKQYDAFVSYSSHDREWVEVFVRNLENCGVKVWWDRGGIRPGESWVARINEGLDMSHKILLIVSPSSMASFRVMDEVNSAIASQERWKAAGKVIRIQLRWAPVLPLLVDSQLIDLSKADESQYVCEMGRLAGDLGGRQFGETAEVHLPPAFRTDVPQSLLKKAVELFARICWSKTHRKALAEILKKQDPTTELDVLENFPIPEITATAFFVKAGAEGSLKRLRRLVNELPDEIRVDLEQADRGRFAGLLEEIDQVSQARPVAGGLGGLLRQYLDKVEAECNSDLLGLLFPKVRARFLDEVYVELHAVDWEAGFYGNLGAGAGFEKALEEQAASRRRNGWRLSDFLASNDSRCWTLQGDPGSGKTTLLLHLAFTLCRRMIGAVSNGPKTECVSDASEKGAGCEATAYVGSGDKPLSPLIPVYVVLNKWHDSGVWIWDYLQKVYRGRGLKNVITALASEAAAGRVLWLLDGFDEVPPKEAHEVALKVHDLAGAMSLCQVVMTSRRFGYRRPGPEFRELELIPLAAEARQRLLEYFVTKDRAAAILNEVKASRSLKKISGNPFFLTLIGVVAQLKSSTARKSLPKRISELLGDVEELLLNGKPGKNRTPLPHLHQGRKVLEKLALELLYRGAGPYDEDVIDEVLFSDEVFRRLRDRRQEETLDTGRFLKEVAEHTGLLAADGFHGNRWRFLHRSIQEHMAARYLKRLGRDQWEPLAYSLKMREGEKTTDDKSRLGQWAETFAYLAGEMSDPNALLKDLMTVNADLGLRALATADCVAQETLEELLKLTPGGSEWGKRQEVIESIPERVGATKAAVQLLAKIRGGTTHGADLYFISEAYRAIAALTTEAADSDPEVELLALEHDRDLFEEPLSRLSTAELEEIITALQKVAIGGEEVDLWRRIPAGEFLMGSPKDDEGRSNREPTNHQVKLSALEMSAVPVTNKMYEHFDPSHDADRVFRDKIPTNERIEDHPVVSVTWYEAVMFCRWATEVLRRYGKTGHVHLPSEAQWEYACRAGQSTCFWSGNKDEDLAEVGWYDANSEGRTHPVGTKPANAWGLHDVHGNVWEWCHDTWHEDLSGGPTDGSAWGDEGSLHVLRGGGWGNFARDCRCACRGNWEPGDRDGILGFRLVLAVRNNRDAGPFS